MKSKEPFVEAMENYRKAQVYPLHTPGHKGGRGACASLAALLGAKALASDVSLMEELDDIHNPHSCLQQAEQLAAELYGATRTFFVPNGTTGALHALLLGALRPGDKILLPRNAHRSVYGGVILAGLEPVYLVPEYSADWQMPLQVTAEDVSCALKKDPDIKAVFLTSPNYYGLAADTTAIAKLIHAHGGVLLVDEAHGPHLGFSSHLPPSALSCGADGVAQSTHKIVGALTQCSLLHFQGKRLNGDFMAKAMSLVTTTSPNNLLLASLDASRAQLAKGGQQMVEAALAAAAVLRGALDKVAGLRILDERIIGIGGVVALDATKVTVDVRGLGLTGIEAGALLRRNNIAVELVDESKVLFLVTYGDELEELTTVAERIAKALDEGRKPLTVKQEPLWLPPLPQSGLNLRQAFFARKEVVHWTKAVGRLSGEELCFYPPGIPLLLPGEIITEDLLYYCRKMLDLGMHMTGPTDGSLETIQVINNA